MTERKTFHAHFTLFALAMAVVSLPFSIKLCHFALFLLILNWTTEGRWKEKWNAITGNSVVVVLILFFALHLLGLLYTEDTVNGWFNIEKKMALVIVPIILVSTPRLNKKYVDLIFQFFIVACGAGTLVCIFKGFIKLSNSNLNIDTLATSLFWSFNPDASKKWMYFSYTELASGIDIHPTYFSLYLVFCLLVLYQLVHEDFFERSKRSRIFLIALFFYFSFFIICLSSRITTIAFLFMVSIGVYQLLKNRSQISGLAYSFLILSFFVFLVYFNPVSRYRNYQEITHSSYPAPHAKPYALSTDMRASLWWLGLKSMMDVNVIWGAGTGDVEQVMKDTGIKYSISNILGTNNPHNQFLYTALSLGLIGLFSLLSCFVLPMFLAYQRQDYFYIVFISLFAFVSLTETTLELQKGIVFFSIFNSLLVFQYSDWSVSYKRRVNYV